MFTPEINRQFTPAQIVKFILTNDNKNIYASEKLNVDEFLRAIKRLNDLNKIIVWKNGQELWGVLGWYFVTDENKHEATKANWRLPKDIVHGDIIYLSFIQTKGNCDVLAVRRLFDHLGILDRITRKRGFTKGKWYEDRIYKKES